MTLTERAAVAVQTAMRELALDVYDPPAWEGAHLRKPPPAKWILKYRDSLSAIRGYYARCGWKDKAETYNHDGDGEWCGIFVGACYRSAGLRLDVARSFLPSTARLDAFGRGQPFNDKKPPSTKIRLVSANEEPLIGDILVVGHGKDYGDHITLVTEVNPIAPGPSRRWFVRTIEGNAIGQGPDGVRREGVVTRLREDRECVRRYRLAEEDFT